MPVDVYEFQTPYHESHPPNVMDNDAGWSQHLTQTHANIEEEGIVGIGLRSVPFSCRRTEFVENNDMFIYHRVCFIFHMFCKLQVCLTVVARV